MQTKIPDVRAGQIQANANQIQAICCKIVEKVAVSVMVGNLQFQL